MMIALLGMFGLSDVFNAIEFTNKRQMHCSRHRILYGIDECEASRWYRKEASNHLVRRYSAALHPYCTTYIFFVKVSSAGTYSHARRQIAIGKARWCLMSGVWGTASGSYHHNEHRVSKRESISNETTFNVSEINLFVRHIRHQILVR